MVFCSRKSIPAQFNGAKPRLAREASWKCKLWNRSAAGGGHVVIQNMEQECLNKPVCSPETGPCLFLAKCTFLLSTKTNFRLNPTAIFLLLRSAPALCAVGHPSVQTRQWPPIQITIKSERVPLAQRLPTPSFPIVGERDTVTRSTKSGADHSLYLVINSRNYNHSLLFIWIPLKAQWSFQPALHRQCRQGLFLKSTHGVIV